VIEGIKTSVALQLRILYDPYFLAGHTSTSFLEHFQRDHRLSEIAQTA
jgi:biotin carboxylase